MKSENYSLMNLEKLNIQEEMNYSCDTMLHIYPTANMDYSVLTDREKSILDKVITKFSAYRAKDIVEYMHKEKAYTETRPGEIILFSLAKETMNMGAATKVYEFFHSTENRPEGSLQEGE